jgi:hypothetical protein
LPVCGRCKRRKVVSECKYEASPSKKFGPTIGTPLPVSPTSTSIRKTKSPIDLENRAVYAIFAAGSQYVQKCPNGFLGPTASSSIFLEKQGKLDSGLLYPCKSYHKHTDDVGLCASSHNNSIPHDVASHPPNAAAIRLGILILNALLSQGICERLIERYDVFQDIVLHKPSIRFNHKSFRDAYRQYLPEPKDPANLSIPSEEMRRNSWSIMGGGIPKNQQEWMIWVKGHDCRWDLVGIFIAMFGLAAISLPK